MGIQQGGDTGGPAPDGDHQPLDPRDRAGPPDPDGVRRDPEGRDPVSRDPAGEDGGSHAAAGGPAEHGSELPGFPPEWGEIRIPDDASELAEEAEQIRRELAARPRPRDAGAGPGPSRPGRPAAERVGGEASVAMPLTIMSIAVMVTLISLFAMTWSGSSLPERAGTGTDDRPVATLPELILADTTGRPVTLSAYRPMALLLVEECVDCADLIAAAVAAAPAGVTVAAVGHSAPGWPAGLDPADGARSLLLLADPQGTVRSGMELDPPSNAATVLLVDASGGIARTVPTATSVQPFRADLAELAGG